MLQYENKINEFIYELFKYCNGLVLIINVTEECESRVKTNSEFL